MVTVCKYFLTNSCRYGDSCRFSHVISDDNYHSNSNPYVYNARRNKPEGGISIMQRFNHTNSTPQSKDDIDKMMPEYLKRIEEDVTQPEQQGMWPLTCYSFLKTQGNLPDWNDISMEECRWEAYQAQANGTMPMYIARIQELLAHARQVRGIYLRPTKQTETIIKNYMQSTNGISTSSNQDDQIFMNSTPSEAQKNFSFASAFSQSQSPVSNSTGIFAKAAQSLASQNSQQSTYFGGKPFISPQERSNNFFGGTTSIPQQTSFFGGSSLDSDSKFPQNKSSFNTGTMMDNSNVDGVLYSKVEELSLEDYEAFKATTFTIENLPLALPPKELC